MRLRQRCSFLLVVLAGAFLSVVAARGAAINAPQPAIVLAVGLLLTVLLGLYTYQLVGHSSRIKTLVAQRTAELSRINQEMQQRILDQAQMASIVNSSNDAIIGYDLHGIITTWNRGAERLFGYASNEIVGQPVQQIIPTDRQQEMARLLARVRQEEQSQSCVTARHHRDGGLLTMSLTLSPIWDAQGELVGVSEIGRDLTAQRDSETLLAARERQLREKAEALQHTVEELTRRERITQSLLDDLQESREQLETAHAALKKTHEELQAAQLQVIQSAKMESVGRLAAGVAHEVKNPLAIILMGVAFLQQQMPKTDEAVWNVVGDIEKAVKRADTVIRGLLDFAAFKELHLTTESLNQVVEQSLLLVRHEFTKARVTVVKELAAELPPVAVDRNKIEQVLINLFVNAAHAMTDKDARTLTVRTLLKRLDKVGPGTGQRTTDQFRVGETAVALEVDDTGPGIAPELLPKVFDPFFTTKPTGQGTGLGLSVTRSIVELHRGVIHLTNRPEGGVRALVMLHPTIEIRKSTEPQSKS